MRIVRQHRYSVIEFGEYRYQGSSPVDAIAAMVRLISRAQVRGETVVLEPDAHSAWPKTPVISALVPDSPRPLVGAIYGVSWEEWQKATKLEGQGTK